jgi:cell division protein FtsL
MSNRLRNPESQQEEVRAEIHEEKSEKGFFRYFDENNSFKVIPFIIFFVIIGIIYIANRHYTHRKVREITQLRQQTEELRVHYTTLKSEVMAESQQAEVAKRVKRQGIIEPEKNKIFLKK